MNLYGASGHGKVILDLLMALGQTPLAVYDDHPCTEELMGVPVRSSGELPSAVPAEWIVSIGNNRARRNVAERLGGPFATAVHPAAVIAASAFLGEGTVAMASAVVNAESRVGRHCILNTGAVIEHDNLLGDFVHISPNASLAGNVTVGEGTQVGIGACVIQGITIGKWAVIGAGAVVIRDVPDHAVVVGNPGRVIRFISDQR